MLRFDVAKLEDVNPWVCQHCRQDQRHPADPTLLQGVDLGPDEDDFPERNWSKEKQDAWDEGERKFREYERKKKFGSFGPRD
jgi:hypothetical protein